MSGDQVPKRKTGYKSPPVEHQFKKGNSGNPAGRKRKEVRSLLPRQLRNDVLKVGGTKTRVRTPDGDRDVTAFEAILIRICHRALAGHGPSMKLFVQLYEGAVLAHFEDFKEYFEGVDYMERQRLIKSMPPDEEERFLEFLDELRERTRRL